uniref:Phage related protein n=1 Tax=Bartonella schoenbuchensis TaxID=165694 RepID=A0A024LT24_9HYPH|nr:phage related protein [Bartonella schoenbuchensis]
MATKSPWVKFYPSQFLIELMLLKPKETAVYTTLVLLMLHERAPIFNDASDLKIVCSCSVWTFRNILESLMSRGYIIRLESGRLWYTSSAVDLDISNISSERKGESYVN